MKLIVFSICLNEEKTIGELLDRIPKKIEGIDEIVKVVIDDGSKDKTVQIAKGKGAFCKTNVDAANYKSDRRQRVQGDAAVCP